MEAEQREIVPDVVAGVQQPVLEQAEQFGEVVGGVPVEDDVHRPAALSTALSAAATLS